MKRVSKRVREEAILISDIAASEELPIGRVVVEVVVSDAAVRLALEAVAHSHYAYRSIGGLWSPYAEAAQLLREGWLPEGWS